MLKFAFILCALMNFDPSQMLGMAAPPAILLWAWENKGYACMMAFFIGEFSIFDFFRKKNIWEFEIWLIVTLLAQ